MIDSCTIVRRDPQVDGEHGRLARADPASVVLDMLCEAMKALTLGHVADDVACRYLGEALQVEAAVTFTLAPGVEPSVAAAYPDTAEVRTIARQLLERGLQIGEEHFFVEHVEGVGYVASMVIQPLDLPRLNQLSGQGRVMIYAREVPFEAADRLLLDRARDALVALWPHAERSIQARQAQEWVRETVEDTRMTERELQVLGLLAEGLLATSIASRLRLSPRTVHKHLGNIYRKLGVHDRLVAVSLARLQGLVDTYPQSPTSPVREQVG